MHEDLAGARQMYDIVLVRSARRQIGQALANLAVRPLDEDAAAAMRQALRDGRPASAALRRLAADTPDQLYLGPGWLEAEELDLPAAQARPTTAPPQRSPSTQLRPAPTGRHLTSDRAHPDTR